MVCTRFKGTRFGVGHPRILLGLGLVVALWAGGLFAQAPVPGTAQVPGAANAQAQAPGAANVQVPAPSSSAGSFGPKASAPKAAGSGDGKGAITRLSGDRVRPGFRDAEIDAVAAAFAQLMGRPILVDPRVKGRITLEAPRPISRNDAFVLFQAALRLQALALLDFGDHLRLVSEADAKLHGGPVSDRAGDRVGERAGDRSAQRGGDRGGDQGGEQLLTRIFRLRYELASNLLPVLRPLIPPNNAISAMPSNNALVVTDYASNLERIAVLIGELDAPTPTEFESIPIRHGAASDVAVLVGRLIEASEVGSTDARLKVSLIPEPRSNSLLVRSASPARMAQLRLLVEQVDQPSGKPGNIHVVYLKNAEAARLALTLRGILSGEGTGLGGAIGASSAGSSGAAGGGYFGGTGAGGGFGAAGSAGSGAGLGAGGGSGGAGTGGLAAGAAGLAGGALGALGAGGSTGMAGVGQGAGGFGGAAGGMGGGLGGGFAGGLGGGASGAAAGVGSQQAGGASITRLGGVVIAADPSTNSLIITAPEPVFRDIRAVIDKLDVRRAQVYIESLIVEVNADKASELGFQWQFLNGGASGSNRVIGGTNLSARGEGTNILDLTTNILGAAQGLNIGVLRSNPLPGAPSNATNLVNLGVLANALQSRANGNVLATPNLLTLDNEEARIIIGQNVPFVTGSYVSTGAGGGVVNPFQTVERRDVGTTLRVRPQVSEGGTVKLAIYQEVSSIQDKTLSAGLITNRRAIESNVLVEDGQIVVLGGLIEDRTGADTQSIPFLGDLPIAGQLFRYDVRTRSKTNLLVFLRPRVLRSADSAGALTQDRYEFMRGVQREQVLPAGPLIPGQEVPQLPLVPPAAGSPR
ncbi:MAG: type II secretion system protein GspD [Betaproteobacteria bacterium]|nr:type II secretion system protein GspD [Betaproteobacteria bacterium]